MRGGDGTTDGHRSRKRLRSPAVRLEDVARAAGVSTATVSRTLNTPDGVSIDVRARVLATVERLGYLPHGAARALSSQRSRTVGVILPTIDNAMFARGIHALQKHLAERGYLMLLAITEYDPEVEYRQARNLVSRGAEALVLRGDAHVDALRRLLAQTQIPFVNVGVYHPEKQYASVGIDNARVAFEATRHLIGLGHVDIGMLAAICRHNDRAAGRLAGFRKALRSARLPMPATWVKESAYDVDAACQAASAILGLKNRPTALVCSNDVLAYGALLAAERLGITVPRELSVIGFGDLAMSRHTHPPLTTVHIPIDEVWIRGGDFLLRRLAGESPPLHYEVPVSLVARESTGRPPPRPRSTSVTPVRARNGGKRARP